MRRLVYIVFIAAFVGVWLSAQDGVEPDAFGLPLTDSVVADTAAVADTDSTLGVPAMPAATSTRRRHVTAVNNEATRTQHHNDAAGDTARMIERRRQRSVEYRDETGHTVMVDTVTGEEWVDSTLLPKPPKMKYPLMYRIEVGVNIWDAVMRIFGQKYGLVDFSAALNMHNRYIATVEAGIGTAHKTPETMNYTYVSPLAPYFKVGADYNFVYNSSPDYRFVAGLRYGISMFSYRLEDATFNQEYWGQTGIIPFPSQRVTAGWLEFVLGLRVKIVGPVSAGWMFRYHYMLHQTKSDTGEAWYVPGFGPVKTPITGSFSIVYNLDLPHRERPDLGPATDVGNDADAMALPADSSYTAQPPVSQPDVNQPEDNQPEPPNEVIIQL